MKTPFRLCKDTLLRDVCVLPIDFGVSKERKKSVTIIKLPCGNVGVIARRNGYGLSAFITARGLSEICNSVSNGENPCLWVESRRFFQDIGKYPERIGFICDGNFDQCLLLVKLAPNLVDVVQRK